MEQKDVVKRLIDYIEYDALMSQSAFASKAGIDPSGFIKMLKGQQTITMNTLKKISITFGLNLKWLADGEGPEKAPGGKPQDYSIGTDETRPRIPQTVAAGSLSGFSDGVILPDCEQVPVIKAFPPYDYTMIVKGDSMEPKFEGGDEIAIRRVYDYIEWGKNYVLDTRDGAVLKRLYDEGDNYRCVSFNSDYPDFLVNKNDVFGVFKVVGLLRI